MIGDNIGEDKPHSWLDNVSKLDVQILNVLKADISEFCSITVHPVQVQGDPDCLAVTEDDVGDLLRHGADIGGERDKVGVENVTEQLFLVALICEKIFLDIRF